MEFQIQVISGRHEQWSEFIDWSKMRIQILGTPSDVLVRCMGQVAEPGVPLRVTTPLDGVQPASRTLTTLQKWGPIEEGEAK
jgi:hypothetical protein